MYFDRSTEYRKSYLVGLFDRLCSQLDISDARRQLAADRYDGVAEWLAAGEHRLLHGLSIYLQGSTALGTSVRPIQSLEHDVDVVSFMPAGSSDEAPSRVKTVIGDRLRANGTYAKLLVEKKRCWRLVYANEFHIDITPAIRNWACGLGGELVPDKALRQWKETNPKGYRTAFERRAALLPMLRMKKAFDEARARADSIEPFPVATRTRSLLCRIVQIAKRHRDVHFENVGHEHAPISVIVTTLLAWSYEQCVTAQHYDTEYDVMLDVMRRMPEFIGQRLPDGRAGWHIPNESTHGENFAEGWNQHPERASAFFAWHAKAVSDLEALGSHQGADRVRQRMNDAFGAWPVSRAFAAIDEEIAAARRSGRLYAAPLGITTTATAAAVPVLANTFYGRDPA